MRRYYFHTEDGRCFPDEVGVELPDLQAVREVALRAFGEMARELDGQFWEAGSWRMIIKDDRDLTLFTLELWANDAAAMQALGQRRS